MDYFEFRQSLESTLSKLKLPADCVLDEPTWVVIIPPISWTVEMCFRFEDNKHVLIWESHDKFAKLQASRRIQWSYHYGDITARDGLGNVVQGVPDDPLEIRIDTCSGRVHMHYLARQPHYGQERVNGLDLTNLDAIQFVKGIFKHRKTGQPLTKVYGFKLT